MGHVPKIRPTVLDHVLSTTVVIKSQNIWHMIHLRKKEAAARGPLSRGATTNHVIMTRKSAETNIYRPVAERRTRLCFCFCCFAPRFCLRLPNHSAMNSLSALLRRSGVGRSDDVKSMTRAAVQRSTSHCRSPGSSCTSMLFF